MRTRTSQCTPVLALRTNGSIIVVRLLFATSFHVYFICLQFAEICPYGGALPRHAHNFPAETRWHGGAAAAGGRRGGSYPALLRAHGKQRSSGFVPSMASSPA